MAVMMWCCHCCCRRENSARTCCVVEPARPGAVLPNAVGCTHGAEGDDRRRHRGLYEHLGFLTSPPEGISESAISV